MHHMVWCICKPNFCFGKTPMQTFIDSQHLADEKMLDKLTVDDAVTA